MVSFHRLCISGKFNLDFFKAAHLGIVVKSDKVFYLYGESSLKNLIFLQLHFLSLFS